MGNRYIPHHSATSTTGQHYLQEPNAKRPQSHWRGPYGLVPPLLDGGASPYSFAQWLTMHVAIYGVNLTQGTVWMLAADQIFG